jgi:hypothetical protein
MPVVTMLKRMVKISLGNPELSIFGNNSIQHVVHVPSSISDFPTCTCGKFQSTWIPCSHICAVYGRIPNKLFVVNNLHPHWHLKNHPLFEKGLETLGLKHSSNNDCVVVDGGAGSSLMEQYENMSVPSEKAKCYQFALQLGKEFADLASTNKHLYKMGMLKMTGIIQFLKDGGLHSELDDGKENEALRPPKRKKVTPGPKPMTQVTTLTTMIHNKRE